ncbi:hypothetical protein, partial [Flavobacterium sp. A45]|uniref:hypothetical protein n=1 Tax=Flavobacterium sp. A45 TaxID=1945862 RepID=UPI0009873905
MKKNIFYFVFFAIFAKIIFSCNESDQKEVIEESHYLPVIDVTNLPKENRPMTMFKDDENPSKMYDSKDRWFQVNQPMQIILNGKDSVQVSLYSPVALNDVKVYVKVAASEKRFLIFNFKKIPAFHRSFHQIPLVNGKRDYLTEDGGTVTIDKMEGFTTGNIEFSVESSDPLLAKFKKIESSRMVQFNTKYHLEDPVKFGPMNPVLAKEAITMIINFSFALSHPLFYNNFMNFDKYKEEVSKFKGEPLTGALNLHGNEEDLNGVYDYFTKEQLDKVYTNYIDKRTLNMAMAINDTAWGAGALVSQSERKYIEGHWKGDMSTWAHEYGHHSGYQHSSNLANKADGGGLQTMMANLYVYLIYLDELPFTDPEVLKSYSKTTYLKGIYKRPVFKIKPDNPFLLKYKGGGR